MMGMLSVSHSLVVHGQMASGHLYCPVLFDKVTLEILRGGSSRGRKLKAPSMHLG